MLPWLAMGFFSYLLVLTILRDVSLIASVLALSPQAHESWIRISATAVMALTPAITLVGFFMARRVAPVVDVKVPLAGLPKELEGFTIAQISDIHVGQTIKRNFVEAIVDRVNLLKADMVAITGDVVDGSVPDLAHQPRSAPFAEAAGYQLQLSGHTHGGQFWPWNFLVRLQQPFIAGLNRLGRMWVYVSRGTGYWGPPMRFGIPSEITLIRLVGE